MPSKLSSSEVYKDYRTTSKHLAYLAPPNEADKDILALDIPLLYLLPRDITPSFFTPTWDASLVHMLVVDFTGGGLPSAELRCSISFFIPIQSFDLLPLYRQFREPAHETHTSRDRHTEALFTLPVTCAGPQDQFSVDLKVRANPMLNKRVKGLTLKLISVKLKEVLECFDGGLPAHKEVELLTFSKDYDKLLTTEGVSETLSFVFPSENDWLALYDSSYRFEEGTVANASATFIRTKNYTKPIAGIPLTNTQSFSISGKLFTLRHEFQVKIKISHGRNLEFSVPFTVSPFNVASCNYLFLWIREECNMARDRFGRETVAEIASTHNHEAAQSILHLFCLPPTVYPFDRTGWKQLGYHIDSFGKSGTPVVAYID